MIRQTLDVQLSVQLKDYLNSIIIFLSGLVIGIVTTYLGHLLSVRRKKSEEFSPYLTRLYGIVSRIMDHTSAEHFNTYYSKIIEAAVNEKMRELAIKELTEGEATQIPIPILQNPSFVASFPFAMSLHDLLVVMRECRDFESVYAEMEKKGLVQKLKLDNKRLSGFLGSFHSSTEYVTQEIGDVIKKLEELGQTGTVIDMELLGPIFQSDALQKMLNLATHNLFHFGSQLEKELEKHV